MSNHQSNFDFPVDSFELDGETTALYHFEGNSNDETTNYNDGVAYGNLQYNKYPQALPGGHCPKQNMINSGLYYGTAYVNNQLAPKGTIVRMYSPRHELVGCGVVGNNGIYPYTKVFGEPDMIEGMNHNEPITFWVNNLRATTDPVVVNWNDGVFGEANLYVERINDFLPTPTLIPSPTPSPVPTRRIMPPKITQGFRLTPTPLPKPSCLKNQTNPHYRRTLWRGCQRVDACGVSNCTPSR